MSKAIYGLIVGYRTGPKSQCSKECILKFPNFESLGEVAHLIGRKVAWPVRERTIRGKIVGLHGRRGLVKARFRKGVPGQAIGTLVEVIG